ncbi:MAG: hypothetical protein SFV22_02905, partial [Saprospiraceae bacterium]|nr:hypothetical protein [Saprospiraceae bacterium]
RKKRRLKSHRKRKKRRLKRKRPLKRKNQVRRKKEAANQKQIKKTQKQRINLLQMPPKKTVKKYNSPAQVLTINLGAAPTIFLLP